ncbi:MAG: protease inhibitor I9 family protein [Gemmatimonadaceae bacterium]|nr:protease inhibitor I9 family protein [Gemmatimonadaceae bacterium]
MRAASKARERVRASFTIRTKRDSRFSAHLPPSEIESVRRHPDVALVERDARIQVTVTQSTAVWGLDRIDQTAIPLNGAYTYTARAPV